LFFTHRHTWAPSALLCVGFCVVLVWCSVGPSRLLPSKPLGVWCPLASALLWVCFTVGEVIQREHENWNQPSLGPFPKQHTYIKAPSLAAHQAEGVSFLTHICSFHYKKMKMCLFHGYAAEWLNVKTVHLSFIHFGVCHMIRFLIKLSNKLHL